MSDEMCTHEITPGFCGMTMYVCNPECKESQADDPAPTDNGKICGTCALSAPKYGTPGKLVCLAGACSVDPSCKCMIYECGATKLCYRERTVSIEQIAAEMFHELCLLASLCLPRSARKSVARMHIRRFYELLRSQGVDLMP